MIIFYEISIKKFICSVERKIIALLILSYLNLSSRFWFIDLSLFTILIHDEFKWIGHLNLNFICIKHTHTHKTVSHNLWLIIHRKNNLYLNRLENWINLFSFKVALESDLDQWHHLEGEREWWLNLELYAPAVC